MSEDSATVGSSGGLDASRKTPAMEIDAQSGADEDEE